MTRARRTWPVRCRIKTCRKRGSFLMNFWRQIWVCPDCCRQILGESELEFGMRRVR